MARRGWVRLMQPMLVLGVIAGAPTGLRAQLPPSLLETLTPGRRARIELRDSARVTGRVQSVRSDLVTLNVVQYLNAQRAVAVMREIPADSLRWIWVTSGTQWKKGAAAGGALGAGLALTLGILLGGGGGDWPECRGGCLARGTTSGAGIGAGIGAVIGLFFLRWKLVY